MRREQPAERALEAHAGARLRLAQLRQVDDRRALRHRERRHRPPPAFYRTYYQPDNAVLVVAGRFDPAKTLALIAKHFGAIPKPARALPRLYTRQPVQDGERTVTVRRAGSTEARRHRSSTRCRARIRTRRARGAGRDPDRRAGRPPVQGAGRDARRPSASRPGRSRSPIPARSSSGRRFRSRIRSSPRAMRCSPRSPTSPKQPITADEVARVRAKALNSYDELFNDPEKLGGRALGGDRHRRLAAYLPRSATSGASSSQRTSSVSRLRGSSRPTAQSALSSPTPAPIARPIAADVDVAALLKDYKGDASVAAGETFDATPANLDARTQRFTLAERPEGRVAAEKDARQYRALHDCGCIRETRKACWTRCRRELMGGDAVARHAEARSPGVRGRARSSFAPSSRCPRRKRRPPPAARRCARTCRRCCGSQWRPCASPSFPPVRVRQAEARGRDGARSEPHRADADRAACARASRQSLSQG